MVLFHSLGPSDISNPDDLKLKTVQFFARGGGSTLGVSLGGAPSAGGGRQLSGDRPKTAEAELCDWLERNGYKYKSDCAIGGSVAVAEVACAPCRSTAPPLSASCSHVDAQYRGHSHRGAHIHTHPTHCPRTLRTPWRIVASACASTAASAPRLASGGSRFATASNWE